MPGLDDAGEFFCERLRTTSSRSSASREKEAFLRITGVSSAAYVDVSTSRSIRPIPPKTRTRTLGSKKKRVEDDANDKQSRYLSLRTRQLTKNEDGKDEKKGGEEGDGTLDKDEIYAEEEDKKDDEEDETRRRRRRNISNPG